MTKDGTSVLQKILLEVVTATRLYSLSMVGTPLLLPDTLKNTKCKIRHSLSLVGTPLLLPDALSALLPVKPFLAKAPENVSTDAGSTARFSCAVDGVPKPKVFFSSLDNLSFFSSPIQHLCNTPHLYHFSRRWFG